MRSVSGNIATMAIFAIKLSKGVDTVITRDGKELSLTSKKHIPRLDGGESGWRQPTADFMASLEAEMKRAMTTLK